MQGGTSLHVSLQVEFDFVDTEGGPGAEMLLVRAEYVGIDMDSMTKFKDKEVCDILPVCVPLEHSFCPLSVLVGLSRANTSRPGQVEGGTPTTDAGRSSQLPSLPPSNGGLAVWTGLLDHRAGPRQHHAAHEPLPPGPSLLPKGDTPARHALTATP